MNKKEILKQYKKGTEVVFNNNLEEKGHIVGHHEVSKAHWGPIVKMCISGEEINTTIEEITRVYKDDVVKEGTTLVLSAPAAKKAKKAVDKLFAEQIAKQTTEDPVSEQILIARTELLAEILADRKGEIIQVHEGDVVDEETGDVIRKMPDPEVHPMESLEKVTGGLLCVVGNDELAAELEACESIAAKIRLLLKRNMGRVQVAKALGVGYRYVYAIEHKTLKRELPYVIIPNNTK